MKTMFTPRELPPPPPPQCKECARLEYAWRADEERIFTDSHVIARLTGLLRRLRLAAALSPAHGSDEEQGALRALLAQVDDALDREA